MKVALETYREVIVIDKRQEGGCELLELCRKKLINLPPNDVEGLLAVKVCYDGHMGAADFLEANNQAEDQFDSISEDKDGIIRIR